MRFQSLRARLLLLLTLAVLPLGMISLSQTRLVLEEAEELERASLMARTIAAAGTEREIIQKALGIGQGLETVVRTLDGSACSDAMATFVQNNPEYLFAGFIPADGLMTCSSGRRTVDFSDNLSFASAKLRQEQFVSMNSSGVVTGLPVVIASHPVFDDGAWIGVMSVSLPHELARQALAEANGETEIKMVTLNLEGTVLATSDGSEHGDGLLPKNLAAQDLFDRVGTTFGASSRSGDPRVFAVSEMIDDAVILVGSWPDRSRQGAPPVLSAVYPLVFPVLMWVAGLAVAYFSVERLVLRHMRKLISAMRRFALGQRSRDGLRLPDAPEELQDAARAFNRMALVLTDAEARQVKDVQDKEVLLREVHHRVKNNLQLIASIMNMQARATQSPEAQSMLAGLQRRVRSLAMMHRSLYTTTEMSTVDSADLVRSLVADINELAVAQEQGLQMRTELDSVPLFPDQAVPLSMLLAEALVNAIKYAGRTASGEASVLVQLEAQPDGMIEVKITNTKGTPLNGDAAFESGGVGSNLMRAFVAQLSGTQGVAEQDDRYTYTVHFPRMDFEPEDHEASDAA
jgi:two-component sensor histidine kinase